MIRLFIQNQEVELNSEVQIAITKQFEDITNPTTIINDWSKTVEIPFTQSNNKLFGNIFNPDKVIVNGGLTGVYFNPLQKLSFRLQWADTVIMQGYCKLNEVKQNDGKGTYNVTLFGELGKVFSEMKKITFDTTSDYSDYIIDGSQYVNEYINRQTVNESWVSNGQSSPNLVGRFTNYIGFAPNNSFSEGFDYKTYQIGSEESNTFTTALEKENFAEVTGVEPSTTIPNGLLPREIGEYRSYLQLPYIYFNKLFKIFQRKAEDITGYRFNLSPNWFNTSNPYWYDLVYMLKSLNVSNGDSFANYYRGLDNMQGAAYYLQLARWLADEYTDYTREFSGRLRVENIVSEQMPILTQTASESRITITDDNPITTVSINMNTEFIVPMGSSRIKSNNGLLFTVYVKGENNVTESRDFLIVDENSDLTYNDATIIKIKPATQGDTIYIPTMKSIFSLTKLKFGNYVTMGYNFKWLVDSYPFTGAVTGTFYMYLTSGDNESTIEAIILNKNIKRSNVLITLNDLWNNEYNVFNEILNYCKMYRIGIFVNENDKTISFTPLSEYFSNYNISDWTDKLDKSKDYNIKPITFENKYILFNYEDNNTKLEEQYRIKYGVNYGEEKITTDYNFNDETTKLFEKVKTSINNTDNVLSWINIFNNLKIIYSFPSEIYVYNKDADNKQKDIFGSYYFFRGLREFDRGLQLRSVYLSDDTYFQQYNNTYFYSQRLDGLQIYTYPYLSVIKDNNMCLFNVPMENYTYLSNEYNGSSGIYTNFWKSYINERYNINNKVVTCYLKISPYDYINFEFNKFIKIGNQLYMVNKIYDYNITSNESTKVDLITIQDIKGYTTNNFTINN